MNSLSNGNKTMNNTCSGHSRPIASARLYLTLACLLCFNGPIIRAADYYVRPPGAVAACAAPYAGWETAATQIQWAVNVAMTNLPATVWVANGAYCVTSQVTITNAITVKSVNGWTNTLVYADWPGHTTRCFYVANAGVVDGFAISNGHYMESNAFYGGGGIYLASGAVARNCLITHNICSNVALIAAGGGGAYVTNARIQNCIINANISIGAKLPSGRLVGGGGGVMLINGIIDQSIICSNSCDGIWAYGGGLYLEDSRMDNCSIAGNYASGPGGGIYMFGQKSFVTNCIITANSGGSAGGVLMGAEKQGGKLWYSVISNNVGRGQNQHEGGGIKASNGADIRNCRIVDNVCAISGRGISFGAGVTVSNCFIAGNRYEQ